MAKFSRHLAAVLLAAVLGISALSGCSSKTDETAAAEETEEGATAAEDAAEESSEEEIDYEAAYDQIEKDEVKVDLLNPVKPDNLGTINNLVYKGLSFEAPYPEEVTMDDVDDYLDESILPYVPAEIEGATAEDGDIVNIDYAGYKDGVAFDGGTAEGYSLELGSGSFIEGFEEGLIGAKAGDTLSLSLTFPEDYWSEELAGADVVFEVTVNSVSRIITSGQLNDAVARTIMDDETATAESCREYLYNYLVKLAKVSAKSSLYKNALAAATEASDIEPSEEAEEWEIDITIKSYDSQLEQQGWTLATYLYYCGMDYDTFRESLEAEIGDSAKELVLRYAVCEAEGLEYNDETRSRYLEEFDYTSEELDEVATELDQEQAVIWYLAAQAIVDNGNVTYVEPEE